MRKVKISSVCDKYGKKIDELTINKKYDELEKYLLEVREFANSNETPEYAPIFYYLGTGISTIVSHNLRTNSDKKSIKKEEYTKILSYYRKSYELSEQVECSLEFIPSLYCNYANELENVGRVIEAIRIYRKGIALCPEFSMLYANYGRALCNYANIINDSGQRKDIHCYAYQAIYKALELNDPNMHEDARKYFEKKISDYESFINPRFLKAKISFNGYDLGRDDEFKYRKWCLKNHLFLNPMNDIIEEENAFAHDPLTIIDYIESSDSERDSKEKIDYSAPPRWYAMLNQLKEEYIYARYISFEGIENSSNLHYADKDVLISLSDYNSISYSIRIEHLKSAYRILYSLFDKIAFLINDFWCIDINEYKADVNCVFQNNKLSFPCDNTALNAIYWSNIELRKKQKKDNKVTPYESELSILRNALEHKFLKFHNSFEDEKIEIDCENFYNITEEQFIKKLMRLLEISREWIMELIYAIELENRKNKSDNNILNFYVKSYDEWKI